MKKNPFSLYDFLGYVFPGMLALVIIYSVYSIIAAMGDTYVAITPQLVINHFKEMQWEMGWENTVVFIVVSYCAGHILAYASSLTVEKVSIWMYGYPSSFIMGNSSFFNKIRLGLRIKFWKNFKYLYTGCHDFYDVWKRSCELLWKITTCLLMLPVVVCCAVLGYVFQMEKIYVKDVDGTLKDVIQKHTKKLLNALEVENNEEVDFKKSSSDYHRLIYNYEYEKQEAHRHKMDNYVAIYGFLRALTFIFNCLFMTDLIYVWVKKIPLSEVWPQLLLLMGLTYLVFMSFMKFYRRFTMESFMCLSIDTDIK